MRSDQNATLFTVLKPVLKRLWVGLRNAKTFRRCEEPLGIDTESIEIGQKFFRMLDEEHLLYNFSAASLMYMSPLFLKLSSI